MVFILDLKIEEWLFVVIFWLIIFLVVMYLFIVKVGFKVMENRKVYEL